MKTLVLMTTGNKVANVETKKVYVLKNETYHVSKYLISEETLHYVKKRHTNKALDKLSDISSFIDSSVKRRMKFRSFKFNKSNIMKRAWRMFKDGEFLTFSEALKVSWRFAKNPKFFLHGTASSREDAKFEEILGCRMKYESVDFDTKRIIYPNWRTQRLLLNF
jgi:hypothetical protein